MALTTMAMRMTMTTAANFLIVVAVIVHNPMTVSAYAPQAGVFRHSPAYQGRNIGIGGSSIGSSSSRIPFSAKTRSKIESEVVSPASASSHPPSSTALYHMGHSHSHAHTHSHNHDDDHDHSKESRVFDRQRLIRKLALVLFCWVATCGTKLVQTAANSNVNVNVNGATRFVGLAQSDWISFVVTSVALTSANKITRAIQQSVDNFRQFVNGIRKHSSTKMAMEMNTNTEASHGHGHGHGHDHSHAQNQQHHQQALASAVDKAEADRVTWIGVAVNLLLSVGKLGIGITSHSSALVADAGHSLSDLVSDFITLWSVNVARLPPDEDHPYGHYKFEAIGSLFLSLTLLATGGSVGLMANKQLREVLQASASATASASTAAVQIPGPLALVMAGLSIFSKEWLFRITKQVGDRLRSPVVIANAWHHRSDAYSSVLALLSIAWAMVGFPAADAAAGILVAGMICMTGGEILIESVKQLSDSADSDLQSEIVEILNELDDGDVICTTSVRARQMGSAASVDVTVEIPSVLSTTATSAVEERVRQRLLGELARRRGGGRDSSSAGIIATVSAKPYLEISPLMEDYEYDESAFAKLAFEKFDKDADGRLTIQELKSGLEKTLNIELSDDRVKKLLEEFDVNKDGYLDLEEMVTIDEFRTKMETFSREEKIFAATQKQKQPIPLDEMPSSSYIEQQVRNQAQFMYPKIRSVEGVTVHYTSQNSVTVDVNIRSSNNALEKVRQYARELKDNLETELHEIETARVYLDLNANDNAEQNSSEATIQTKTIPNLAP
uniref:EF-hand domain-containing protein n=1 Tax=Pseudo-nitzschia australis TaxID=44445 RepID=A0A7S4AQI6_9STRA|mmetsp:Transcript_15914/g.34521  ORF Transcript_15914/g.34521 Transcript_15914/m.34521 type:complete len:785 (-) Transcript_15914:538-2892(-)